MTVLPMNLSQSRTEVFRRVSDEKRAQLERVAEFEAVEAAVSVMRPSTTPTSVEERIELAVILLVEAANTLARVLQWAPIGDVTFERAS